MATDNSTKPIHDLIDKAKNAGNSDEALKFSQAAQNVGHAMELEHIVKKRYSSGGSPE